MFCQSLHNSQNALKQRYGIFLIRALRIIQSLYVIRPCWHLHKGWRKKYYRVVCYGWKHAKAHTHRYPTPWINHATIVCYYHTRRINDVDTVVLLGALLAFFVPEKKLAMEELWIYTNILIKCQHWFVTVLHHLSICQDVCQSYPPPNFFLSPPPLKKNCFWTPPKKNFDGQKKSLDPHTAF